MSVDVVRALLIDNEIRYKEEHGFADDLLPVHRIIDAIQIDYRLW